MTNVVPFRPRPKASNLPPAVKFVAVAVKQEPLEPGDLVAFYFSNPETLILGVYDGPTGRDERGRFCRKGSPEECHLIGGLKYTPRNLERGHMHILGNVHVGARLL